MDCIYCVEDDASIRELVMYTLAATGFAAEGFPDGESLFAALDQGGSIPPDLILLDIMLPGEDGNAILARLKENEATAPIPVIMLTARGAEYDKVKALDMGADDYVTKPFGMMELMSRIRAVLRRSGASAGAESAAQEELTHGGIVLSERRHEVTVDGKSVVLTNKEFELLRTMMAEPGVVHSRRDLLDSIWGYQFEGESRTLDVHVATLRQKLGHVGDMIETVRGVGYKMRQVF